MAKKVRAFIYWLYWQPYYFLFSKKFGKENIIVCECYVKYGVFSIKKNNWGDDINKFFIEYCTNKKVFFVPYSKVHINIESPCFLLIGSIVGFYDLNNKYIYGSGVMDPSKGVRGIPRKIYSVRGPKTRQILLNAGIDCPEHYGDPALLLPVFYKPQRPKHNKPVIIPNMGSFEDSMSQINSLTKYIDGVLLDLRKYENWTNVIEVIAGASFVISESLHGLIIAETYSVPNAWVEFKEHPDYWNFKFEDYYESIGKNEKSVRVFENHDMTKLQRKVKEWQRGDIDYKCMLAVFPFLYDQRN